MDANGRILDPTIGRFMSVDPVYQAPTNSQSVNPYSYVMNNPLSLTDPSGYTGACANGSSTACPELYKGHNNTGTMDHLGSQKLAAFDKAVGKLMDAIGKDQEKIVEKLGTNKIMLGWSGNQAVLGKVNDSNGGSGQVNGSSTTGSDLFGPKGDPVRDLTTNKYLTRDQATQEQRDYSDDQSPAKYADGTTIDNPNGGDALEAPAHVSIAANISMGQMMSGASFALRAAVAKTWFQAGGPMDYQRFQHAFFTQYKDFTNYNYGAVMRAAGFSSMTIEDAGAINNAANGRLRMGPGAVPMSDWNEWFKGMNDYDAGKFTH